MGIIINETTYSNMQKNNVKLTTHIVSCENEIRKLQTENNKLKTENSFIIEILEKINTENSMLYESMQRKNITAILKPFLKGF